MHPRGHVKDGASLFVAICFLQEEDPGFVMPPSNFVPTVNEGCTIYNSKAAHSSHECVPSPFLLV